MHIFVYLHFYLISVSAGGKVAEKRAMLIAMWVCPLVLAHAQHARINYSNSLRTARDI